MGDGYYVRTEMMDSMRELDQRMNHMLTAGQALGIDDLILPTDLASKAPSSRPRGGNA